MKDQTIHRAAIGVTAIIVIVLVIAVAWPAEAAQARDVVVPPPPFVPATDSTYAVLAYPRDFFDHQASATQDPTAHDRVLPMRTLARGTRLKVDESFVDVAGGRRLYHARVMRGAFLDTGPQTRGYLFLSSSELSGTVPPETAAAT